MALETATIPASHAAAIVGSHDVWEINHESFTFGWMGGILDDIVRESPEFDAIYVYADGVVHIFE